MRTEDAPKAKRVEGKDVMSTSYQNWERRLDGGKNAEDFTRYIEDRKNALPGEKDGDERRPRGMGREDDDD